MLFPTPEFIFLFLPTAVLLHFALARWSNGAAIVGTTVASLFFYAWWNPPFVLIPVLSIIANFWLARWIQRTEAGWSRALMIFGVTSEVKLKSNSEPMKPFSPALRCLGLAGAAAGAACHCGGGTAAPWPAWA